MVTVKRKDFTVRTNWKSYIENSMENFHLPTVHQGHRRHQGAMASDRRGAGKFRHPAITYRRLARDLGQDAAFDRIATLRGDAAKGAQYILIYPCR